MITLAGRRRESGVPIVPHCTVNVHAPTEEKGEEEKEYFYATLADVLNSSVGNVRIVLGDLNAKLGREIGYRSWIGTHSLHTVTNDNGSKLIDFAVGKSLIKSTMFPRKDIYIYK